jgi:hypothetical protein
MPKIERIDAEGVLKDIIEHIDTGEPVKLNGSRRKVFVVSEKEYKEFARAKNNAEYLAELNKSLWELRNGIGAIKTLDEFRSLQR